MYDLNELAQKPIEELSKIAEDLNIERINKKDKQSLIFSILDAQAINKTNNKKSATPPPSLQGDNNSQKSSKRPRKKIHNTPDKLASSAGNDFIKDSSKKEAPIQIISTDESGTVQRNNIYEKDKFDINNISNTNISDISTNEPIYEASNKVFAMKTELAQNIKNTAIEKTEFAASKETSDNDSAINSDAEAAAKPKKRRG
ncbi:MAG: Rho termination factor N-terminal domain-containing protein, partial [Bacteroidales bacterium]|nr:Rho termination factor N-terminal domain-containing protein [Bacteroidales bacterium]